MVKSGTPINNKDPSPNPGSSSASSLDHPNDNQQQEEPGVLKDRGEEEKEAAFLSSDKWNLSFFSDPKNLEKHLNELKTDLSLPSVKHPFLNSFRSIFYRCLPRIYKPRMIKFLSKKLFGIHRETDISPGISIFFDQKKKPLFIHYSKAGEENKVNQYVVYLIFMKDGSVKRSGKFRPYYGPPMFHSEELMLRELAPFLSQYGNEVQGIFIYSYYSPCLIRPVKKKEVNTPRISCMLQLFCQATEWYKKYNIFTYVAYSEIYCIRYENYFEDLTFDKISCSNNVYHYCFEKCLNTPFEVKHMGNNRALSQYLRKKIKLILSEILQPFENIDKKILHDFIITTHKFFMERAEKSDLYKNLLVSERETLSFEFPLEVQDRIHEELAKEWNKMVKDSFMPIVTECIKVELSKASIIAFEKKLDSILESKSFFRLTHIPHSSSCYLNSLIEYPI